MKYFTHVALLVTASLIVGCVSTPPIVMGNAFQRKVITPCDNDIFCLRSGYSVTWDYTSNNCASSFYQCYSPRNYPVTYKNSEYIVETGSDGYRITLPSGGTVKMFD